MDTIINVILNYVEPDEEITEASTLKHDCGLTSFDTTCVIGELCRIYEVEPSDLDLRSIKTVGELYTALETAKAQE